MKLKIDFCATAAFDEADYYHKIVIRRAVEATLAHEHFPYPARVAVTLCDNAYIHELNKTYRGVDRATDVLSFPQYEAGEFDDAECRICAQLGDVVLSVERAKEQAKEIGHSEIEEIAFLTIHSTLHLLGYDHERGAEDEEAQCKAQREIIREVEF